MKSVWATHRHQALYDMLAQVHTVAAGCARFSAQQDHVVRAADVAQPLLTVVLQGSKQLELGQASLHVAEGEVLVLTQACSVNVRNLTNAHSQGYASLSIALPENVLQAARLLYGSVVAQETAAAVMVAVRLDDIASALHTWAEATAQQQTLTAHMALTQIAVYLLQQGHLGLLWPVPKDLKTQIAQWVQTRPEHRWQSTDIEALMHMSAATLRRRLAAEGSSLKQVILHARMNCALDMLYTQTWPLPTLAAKCGYQSVKVFRQRFEQRFGLYPEQIRSI